MPLKILLVGEGPTDRGLEKYNRRKAISEWQDGALQPLIRKVDNEQDLSFTIESRVTIKAELKKRKGKSFQLLPSPQKKLLEGYALRAWQCALLAKNKNCAIAIYFIDCDNNDCVELYNNLSEGFEAAANSSNIKGISAVAVRTIESWLLSDLGAIEKLSGKIIDEKVKNKEPQKNLYIALTKINKSPERLWGTANDSESHHPKIIFERLLKLLNLPIDTETYCDIANEMDKNKASEKSLSLKTFFDDCEEVINSIECEIT